jgi:hypothetical protein
MKKCTGKIQFINAKLGYGIKMGEYWKTLDNIADWLDRFKVTNDLRSVKDLFENLLYADSNITTFDMIELYDSKFYKSLYELIDIDSESYNREIGEYVAPYIIGGMLYTMNTKRLFEIVKQTKAFRVNPEHFISCIIVNNIGLISYCLEKFTLDTFNKPDYLIKGRINKLLTRSYNDLSFLWKDYNTLDEFMKSRESLIDNIIKHG